MYMNAVVIQLKEDLIWTFNINKFNTLYFKK